MEIDLRMFTQNKKVVVIDSAQYCDAKAQTLSLLKQETIQAMITEITVPRILIYASYGNLAFYQKMLFNNTSTQRQD